MYNIHKLNNKNQSIGVLKHNVSYTKGLALITSTEEIKNVKALALIRERKHFVAEIRYL